MYSCLDIWRLELLLPLREYLVAANEIKANVPPESTASHHLSRQRASASIITYGISQNALLVHQIGFQNDSNTGGM